MLTLGNPLGLWISWPTQFLFWVAKAQKVATETKKNNGKNTLNLPPLKSTLDQQKKMSTASGRHNPEYNIFFC